MSLISRNLMTADTGTNKAADPYKIPSKTYSSGTSPNGYVSTAALRATPTTSSNQNTKSTTAVASSVPASSNTTSAVPVSTAATSAATIAEDSTPVSTVKAKSTEETDWAKEYQQYLEDAREEAIAAKAAAIQAQVEGLEANKSVVNQNADNSKTDVYTNARTSAIGNNDILAAMGLAGNLYDNARSGYSESSRIGQDVALRNNLNTVETQRANSLNDIATQIAQAQATGESDIAGIKSDYANQMAQLQMQMEQQQYERDQAAQEWVQGLQEYKDNLALQEAALTGNYKGQQTMTMQQYLSNLALSEAGLTGNYNGTPTMDYLNLQNTLANGQTNRDATQANMALAQQEAARKAALTSTTGTGSSSGSSGSGYSYAQMMSMIENSDDPVSTAKSLAEQENVSASVYNSMVSAAETAAANLNYADVIQAVQEAQDSGNPVKWLADNYSDLQKAGILEEVSSYIS